MTEATNPAAGWTTYTVNWTTENDSRSRDFEDKAEAEAFAAQLRARTETQPHIMGVQDYLPAVVSVEIIETPYL